MAGKKCLGYKGRSRERERDHGIVRCTREERDNVFHTPWKPESVPTFASKNQ